MTVRAPKASLVGEKRPTSYRKFKNILEKLWILGLGGLGGWGVIFIVNIIKRIARKLSIIILLHFGLVTFRIHFGKTREPIIFMVLGPSGRVHDSHNQL